MTRWKLTIEYDGAGLCGWQSQDGQISVQQVLEEAIEKFSGEPVRLHVAGRTDAGVHARAQVAHVDLAKEIEAHVVRDAINFYALPHKVAIIQAEQVRENFHARFDAIARCYRYRIINRRARLTFDDDYAWHVGKPLDIQLMQAAADMLIGHHDFSTFRASNCQGKSPVRTMDKLFFTQHDEEIILHAEARSFLYHQIRNMAGTFSLVGTGHWSLENFKIAFDARDRAKGGPTAPPNGLFFWEVRY